MAREQNNTNEGAQDEASTTSPSHYLAPHYDTLTSGLAILTLIGGTSVVLTNKVSDATGLTANQARILNLAYVRQFNNNITAKNKALVAKSKPVMTRDEIMSAWSEYEPVPGDDDLLHKAAGKVADAITMAAQGAVASGDQREILIGKVLASEKQRDKVFAQVDALVIEAQVKPAKGDKPTMNVDALDI